MKKVLLAIGLVAVLGVAVCFAINAWTAPPLRIGVSLGVGTAARWAKEIEHMKERAQELGIEIETRFSTVTEPKAQIEDCVEMIDSGIGVLIITARDAEKLAGVLRYAKKKKVKVIAYARAIINDDVDLFIGYDTYRIGQSMGQYLTEKVYKGDIIILKGDENDFNTPLLYSGAMKYMQPMIDAGGLRVILNTFIPNWSPSAAKEAVKKAIAANGNRIDAILAPNDRFAGAAAEALQELNITHHVVITGMDAEIDALKRLLNGTQDITVYLEFRGLARTAVDEAYNLLVNKKAVVNSQVATENTVKIDAYLINGKVVTRENIESVLIEPGYISREAIGIERPSPEKAQPSSSRTSSDVKQR